MPLDRLAIALPGYQVRAARLADAAAVTAVVRAAEAAVQGAGETEQHELEETWAQPGLDLGRDTAVVLDGAAVVAYAEIYKGRADARVAPAARGKGIGTALVGWWTERAAEQGDHTVGQTVNDADAAAVDLLRSLGCTRRYRAWALQRPLGDAPPASPVLPAGYDLRSMAPGEERAVFDVIEAAFRHWEGRPAGRFDDWSARFAAWCAPVITNGPAVVGVALLRTYETEGWVQQIAVDAAHRGRGLGQALLIHAFRTFHERGLPTGLSTDDRTGALDLYRHVGMAVDRSFSRWSRPTGR